MYLCIYVCIRICVKCPTPKPPPPTPSITRNETYLIVVQTIRLKDHRSVCELLKHRLLK